MRRCCNCWQSDAVAAVDVSAAAAAAGGTGKKPRGKPGPKKGNSQKRPAALPEADSVTAAARMNVEANKNLSAKINYKVLDDLFDTTRSSVASAAVAGGLWHWCCEDCSVSWILP